MLLQGSNLSSICCYLETFYLIGLEIIVDCSSVIYVVDGKLPKFIRYHYGKNITKAKRALPPVERMAL
jgi:hypothetical protein